MEKSEAVVIPKLSFLFVLNSRLARESSVLIKSGSSSAAESATALTLNCKSIHFEAWFTDIWEYKRNNRGIVSNT